MAWIERTGFEQVIQCCEVSDTESIAARALLMHEHRGRVRQPDPRRPQPDPRRRRRRRRLSQQPPTKRVADRMGRPAALAAGTAGEPVALVMTSHRGRGPDRSRTKAAEPTAAVHQWAANAKCA
jgi:hypothetical protein